MKKPSVALTTLLLAGCSGGASMHASILDDWGRIRVAAVGADLGRRAAYQVFAEGDLNGSVTHVEWSDFNHLTAEELRESYDVLLFTWVTSGRLNADFQRRLEPFLEQGGGVIFEDPGNTSDLSPVAEGAPKFPYVGMFELAPVPGLTGGVTADFPHNHFAWTAWDGRLAPLQRVNGIVTGLYGGFQGGGRLVVTGTDQHVHGDKRSPSAFARNQYAFLRNELCWAAGCVNQPPVADAGGDRTLECTGATTTVPLDASRSFDTDRDFLGYLWSGPFGSIATEDPTANTELALGAHLVTLTVSDTHGGSTTDTAVIRIRDTVAPAINLSLESGSLWSPDHKLVLAASVGAADTCDSSSSFQVSITSDEPANGTGDGSTAPDWELVPQEDGTVQVWLRAERSGTGDGRVYGIRVTTRDASGNVATAEATVFVAHP